MRIPLTFACRPSPWPVAELQQPHPLLFFGGASPGALEMGARSRHPPERHPLRTKLRDTLARRCERVGIDRVDIAEFSVSVRPIIAKSEEAAWDKANRILAAMNETKGGRRQEESTGPVDNAGKRLMRFVLESDIHGERLWMPIARATGTLGNTS